MSNRVSETAGRDAAAAATPLVATAGPPNIVSETAGNAAATASPPAMMPMCPSAASDAQVLRAQALRLRAEPLSCAAREAAEQAFIDYFQRQEPSRVVTCGARMFERARHDARLPPPVRHALLTALDSSLARVSDVYASACALGAQVGPMQQLAALDVWCMDTHRRVFDAVAQAENPAAPVPLTLGELEALSAHHALLTRAAPAYASKIESLCIGDARAAPATHALAPATPPMGGALAAPAPFAPSSWLAPWQARLTGHLRRLLLMSFDATLSADGTQRLGAFLDTAAGRACLAARMAASGPLPADAEQTPAADQPEMVELQHAMSELLSESAGVDPYERPAYYTEIAERMAACLDTQF